MNKLRAQRKNAKIFPILFSILCVVAFAIACGGRELEHVGGGSGPVESLSLSTETLELLPGERTRLVVMARIGSGVVNQTNAASFRSSNPNVVTIVGSGEALGHGPGASEIVASLDGVDSNRVRIRVRELTDTNGTHDEGEEEEEDSTAHGDLSALESLGIVHPESGGGGLGIRPRAPRVEVASIAISGMPEDPARAAVLELQGRFNLCYASVERPGLLRLGITVGPTGLVHGVSIEEDTLDHTGVASCVDAAVRRRRFPEYEGAYGTATVRLVFGRSEVERAIVGADAPCGGADPPCPPNRHPPNSGHPPSGVVRISALDVIDGQRSASDIRQLYERRVTAFTSCYARYLHRILRHVPDAPRYEGTFVMRVEVAPDGRATNASVDRPLVSDVDRCFTETAMRFRLPRTTGSATLRVTLQTESH